MRKEITSKDFAEFYCLSAISPFIEIKTSASSYKLLAYRNELVYDIAKNYILNLQRACVNEAMYDNCREWPLRINQEFNRAQLNSIGLNINSLSNINYSKEEKQVHAFAAGCRAPLPDKSSNKLQIETQEANNLQTDQRVASENYLYARLDKDSPSNIILSGKRLTYVFRYYNWQQSYGGNAWARIAELYTELCSAFLQIQSSINNYDAECGYDTNTYSNIRNIRDSLTGQTNRNIQNIIHILDMIHQVEHNTGSIFTKFGKMSSWIEKMLNEKAIASSLQVLRRHCNGDIIVALNNLNIIDDQPETNIEEQLGEVIINRYLHKAQSNYQISYNNNLEEIEDDLNDELITQEIYQRKKNKLEREFKENCYSTSTDTSVYTNALNAYHNSPRELYGVYRQIIKHSENKPYLAKYNSSLLGGLRYSIATDHKVFKLFKDANSIWHDNLIINLAPNYQNIEAPWKKEATDFLYSKFPALTVHTYFSQGDINLLFNNLLKDGYDMEPYKNMKKGNSYVSATNSYGGLHDRSLLKYCVCMQCNPVLTHSKKTNLVPAWDWSTDIAYYNVYDVKTLEPIPKEEISNDVVSIAHKYVGKFVKKTKGKFNDDTIVAGVVIGYKDTAIAWKPTLEYNQKYPDYEPVKIPIDMVLIKNSELNINYQTKVHWTEAPYLEFTNDEPMQVNLDKSKKDKLDIHTVLYTEEMINYGIKLNSNELTERYKALLKEKNISYLKMLRKTLKSFKDCEPKKEIDILQKE